MNGAACERRGGFPGNSSVRVRAQAVHHGASLIVGLIVGLNVGLMVGLMVGRRLLAGRRRELDLQLEQPRDVWA